MDSLLRMVWAPSPGIKHLSLTSPSIAYLHSVERHRGQFRHRCLLAGYANKLLNCASDNDETADLKEGQTLINALP